MQGGALRAVQSQAEPETEEHKAQSRLNMLWMSLVAGLCCGVGDRSSVTDTPSPPAAIVIEHINVIDTKTGEVTRDCDVVLRGDRIASVGSMADSAKKKGAKVFD